MLLDQYEVRAISEFFGLYSRGDPDSCPQNHSPVFTNFATRGKRHELGLRPGTLASLAVGNTVRIFNAKFVNALGVSTTNVLTCDGAGNIRNQAGANILTVTNMIDFVGLNLFNHVFLLPICSPGGLAGQVLYIWDGTNAVRPALGAAPTSSFAVAQAAGGNITPGTHQFAVCFVTNTGFTTQPGPKIAGVFTPVSVNFTAGNGTGNVTAIPTGPAGTTQRIILATKANLGVYYFVPAAGGGVINNNVSTTTTLNFLDTDLTIDASSLFNLRESINAAFTGYGGAGMAVYRGRLVILDGTTQNQIPTSQSGLPENFDSVTGLINVDYQQDQFISAFEYFGTLYLSGNVGIHSTSDNGNEPSSWFTALIDSGNGFPHNSLINVLSEKYAGPLGSTMLGVFREGLYMFNGNVVRPCLSLKIQNIFDTFTHGAEHTPELVVDLTQDIIYMLLPLNGSSVPNTLIVGDFSDGLDAENIAWSVYTFPFTPKCLAMISFNDGNDFDYWLRMGTSAGVQKLTAAQTTDSGTPITGTMQTYLSTFGDGTLDIFRYVRVKASGTGTLAMQLLDQGGNNPVTPPNFTLNTVGSSDFGRQINYTNEKMSVTFTYNNAAGNLSIHRVEIYGKVRWAWRPG